MRWIRAQRSGATNRRLTLVAGLSLGAALAVALLAANVMGVGEHPRALPSPSASSPVAPMVATQPELDAALLSGSDLGAGYRPTPTPARSRPAPTAGGSSPAPVKSSRHQRQCRAFFARPWEVSTAGANGLRGKASAEHEGRQRGPRLRQTLGLFNDDAARQAYGQLRATARACPRFEANLEDGSFATVFLRERKVDVRRAAGDVYAVEIIALADQRTFAGYLAAGRVDSILSVLYNLAPAGTVTPREADRALTRALDKMDLLAVNLGLRKER